VLPQKIEEVPEISILKGHTLQVAHLHQLPHLLALDRPPIVQDQLQTIE
jgi:hypothetical protein